VGECDGLAVTLVGDKEASKLATAEEVEGVSVKGERVVVLISAPVLLGVAWTDSKTSPMGGVKVKSISPTATEMAVERREISAYCIAFPPGNASRSCT
jgi:hypothetical protein